MPMSLISIKIFVSSPGDVAQERFLAEKVLIRLQNVYRHVCKLEPIFWEHEPLTADKSFQEGLISPRQTDIVICILWSRLGTRLPRNVSSVHLTGTEFEFVEAVEGRKQKGFPDLLVYRKTAKPFADLSDKQRRREALGQIEALETFFEKWFTNQEGALVAAFHPFQCADDFEQHVEHHLRKLIDGRLAAAGLSAEDGIALTPTWLEGSPFRGLQPFDFQHEPIFFGRTKAVGEVIDRLKRQAEAGRAFLLVLGMSGCGKSSLIRAGVLPALSRPGVIEGVGLCRRAILRPRDGLGDIFDATAAALLHPEALPELARDGTTAAQLARSLRENPAGAAMMVKGTISQAAGGLTPVAEGAKQPQARLLLLVDQLEELFTDDKTTSGDRRKFACLLTSLACDPLSHTWVIATLRSDFYAPLAEVPELADLKQGLGQYDLPSPSPAEIGLLVREPASAAGLRFEQKPEGERLDDVLRDEASRDASLLPLLEFTLSELYERRTDRGKLTFAAYQAIGGVKGALAQRAESTFSNLPAEVQRELPAVFRRLVTVGTLSDETATARQAPLTRFAGSPARMQFVQAFIAARLFVSDLADDESAVVRITHESLLARWQRLQRWLANDRELLRMKARVERAAARWLQEGRRADLLLTAGKPLQEAEQLHAAGFELEPDVDAMIAASRQRARRNRRLRQAAVAALAALALAASGLAVVAHIQRDRANGNARRADENARRAETARDQARQRFQLALDALNDMVFGIQHKLQNRPGTLVLRKDLLENARRGLEKLLQEAEKQGNPDQTLVWSYFRMGDVEQILGNTFAANKEYTSGYELASKLAAADPGNHAAQRDLSASCSRLGDVTLQLGRTQQSLDFYQKALTVAERLAAADAQDDQAQRDLAFGYDRLGDVTLQLGRAQESLDFYRKALAIRERLPAADPQDAQAQRGLCISYDNLGDVTLQLGQTQKSLDFYRKALAIAERLAAADPGDAQAQRDLGVSYEKLGNVALQSGQTKEALGFHRKALAIREHLAAADPENTQAQRDLGVSYQKLGNVALQSGRAQEALDFYQKARAVTERLPAADPQNAQAQRDLGVSYNKLGDLTLQSGRTKEALDFYERAGAIAERLAAADPQNAEAQRGLCVSYNKLGDATLQSGQTKEALRFYQKALAASQRLAAAHPDDAQAQSDLGASYDGLGYVTFQSGQTRDSLGFYQKALAIAERLAAADPQNAQTQRALSVSCNNLGNVTVKLGRAQDALDFYRKALAIRERLAAADPANAEAQRDLSFSHNKLGDVALQLGRTRESLDFYQRSAAVDQRLAAADPQNAQAQRVLLLSYFKIGSVAQAMRDFTKARQWYGKALDVANRFDKPEVFQHEVGVLKSLLANLEKGDRPKK
jgi:tetratricopeptide (TPR) repeat protein